MLSFPINLTDEIVLNAAKQLCDVAVLVHKM